MGPGDRGAEHDANRGGNVGPQRALQRDVRVLAERTIRQAVLAPNFTRHSDDSQQVRRAPAVENIGAAIVDRGRRGTGGQRVFGGSQAELVSISSCQLSVADPGVDEMRAAAGGLVTMDDSLSENPSDSGGCVVPGSPATSVKGRRRDIRSRPRRDPMGLGRLCRRRHDSPAQRREEVR